MDFAVPGYLGDLKSFEKRCGENTNSAAILEPLITPLILRRRVSEVADGLPERIDIPEILELSESETAECDEIRKDIFEECGAAAKLISRTKPRQFCAHPDIISNRKNGKRERSSKFVRLRELLEEIFALGKGALVFISYTNMVDLVAKWLRMSLVSCRKHLMVDWIPRNGNLS